MTKVIITTIIDIEVHISLYTRQSTGIGMLPKLPLSLILHLIHIIVGYPIRIIIENRLTEIFLLKFIIGIDDWFHMVSIFHNMEPSQHITLEIFHTLIRRLVLNIKHWRQITIRKMYLIQEKISLITCR